MDIRRVSYAISITVFFIFLFVVSATKFSSERDIDLWFHLSQGRYIVEHRTVPQYDVFSYTSTTRPDVNQEWGSEVIFYSVYRAFGIAGIIGLKVILVSATFALLLSIAVMLFGRSYLGLALLSVAVVASAFRFLTRPEVISYFLFSVLLLILFRFKYQRAKTLVWLPPLFVLWANLHGGFVLGFVILWIFTFGETASYLLTRFFHWELKIVFSATELRRLWLLTLLASAATLLNPFGLRLLPETVQTFAIVKFANIAEWIPLAFSGARFDVFVLAFFALAAVGALSFLFNSRFFDLTNLLVFLALFVSALTSIRNVSVFAFGSFLIIFLNLKLYVREFFTERSRAFRMVGTVVVASFVGGLLVASISMLARGDTIIDPGRAPIGFGELPNPYAPAVDFLEQHNLSSRLLNGYYLGSYLIWRFYPTRTVFVDGRTYLYDKGYFQKYGEGFESKRGLDELTAAYDLNAIIAVNDRIPLPLRRPGKDPDWQLVYLDDFVSIYARKRPENDTVIERYGYTAYGPTITVGDIVSDPAKREVIRQEAARSLVVNPNQILAHLVLGRAAEAEGNLERARLEYATATLIRPENLAGFQALARSLRQLGREEEAVAAEQQVFTLQPLLREIYGNQLPD